MTVLTHQQAAAFLKVNQATLRKLRRGGQVHGQLVGSQYRYVQEDLESFLRGGAVSATPIPIPVPAEPVPAIAPVIVDAPARRVHHRGLYSMKGGR